MKLFGCGWNSQSGRDISGLGRDLDLQTETLFQDVRHCQLRSVLMSPVFRIGITSGTGDGV